MFKHQIYKMLGRRIAERRKTAGLSQQALADALDLSRASIANIERGKQAVQLHLIFNIATVLKAEVLDLIPTLNEQVDSIQVQDWLKRIESSQANLSRVR